ncbi:MAG: hypothetical protein P1V81_08025 [Planctomycetota bacterium]|nr:hypothetical protein [Planctomycetota bacterium]
MSDRRRFGLFLAGLWPLVLLVYWGLFDSWFLRDDFMWLADARVQLAEPLRFVTTRPSGYFRPMANLFFGIEYLLFGLTATGYLVVNVLLHLTNASLLGRLLLALGAPLRAACAAAATAALLVTAAPGVVWISAIVSLLALGFVLAAAFFHRRFLLDGRLRDGALAVACVALAAASRESGVVAGVGILLVELHHGGPRALVRATFWKRLVPFVLVGAAYLAIQFDFLTSGVVAERAGGARAGAGDGSVLAFLLSWMANLPALAAWTAGGATVSYRTGLVLLVGLPLALGLVGGRRGLVAAAWVLGLALLALLPAFVQLANGPTIAARYRYEASFAAAAAVAALFAFGWGAGGRALAARARQGLALALLLVFLGGHAWSTSRFVDEEERFAVYADQTHAFDAALTKLLAELGAGDPMRLHGELPRTLVLAGAPVENPRHLRDQLAVLHGWPTSATAAIETVVLDLEDADIRAGLRSSPFAELARATQLAEGAAPPLIFVWDRRSRTLVPAYDAEHVFGKLRYDWRRPNDPATSARLRVLRLGAER